LVMKTFDVYDINQKLKRGDPNGRA
jgi:hypothetical protein